MMNNTTEMPLIEGTTPIGLPPPPGLKIHVWLYGFIIFSINVVSCTALSRCKKMCKQIKILSMNMTFTDMGLGVSILYSRLEELFPLNCPLRILGLLMGATFTYCGFLTITLFAVDRCFAVYFAMKYVLIVTPRRQIIICSCAWGMALLFGIISTFVFEKDCFGTSIQRTGYGFVIWIYATCCVVIAACYIVIFIKLHNISAKDRRLHLPVQTPVLANSITKISIIVFVFYLCYTPLIFYLTAEKLYYGNRNLRENIQRFSVLMMSLNSCVNPFLYGWRFPECRNELMKILCCWNAKWMKKLEKNTKMNLAAFLNFEKSA